LQQILTICDAKISKLSLPYADLPTDAANLFIISRALSGALIFLAANMAFGFSSNAGNPVGGGGGAGGANVGPDLETIQTEVCSRLLAHAASWKLVLTVV